MTSLNLIFSERTLVQHILSEHSSGINPILLITLYVDDTTCCSTSLVRLSDLCHKTRWRHECKAVWLIIVIIIIIYLFILFRNIVVSITKLCTSHCKSTSLCRCKVNNNYTYMFKNIIALFFNFFLDYSSAPPPTTTASTTITSRSGKYE